MSKHTPGPWTIDWYVCREGEKELWRVPRSIGPAYVDHNHWARNHIAVDPADALLIAAAPDLLEALQGLLNRPGPIYNLVEDERHWPQIAEARAAIAKATGEQA